jgi:hypothetical protein
MAGITDAWGMTGGHSKTTTNYSLAAFDALRQTMFVKVTDEQRDRLKIVAGPVGMQVAPAGESVMAEEAAKEEDSKDEDVPSVKEIEGGGGG